ncbi:hypothetical protein BLNAU_16967 [Blattamonas nauphoetae]|uniref:Right handed beta helix domain-containing protein n=1 Tax=Blattamonas nauphoetae TaxID=2049346 RepID=A0ABQ9X8T0_9EUKA|nr:hypothetical protein BLNAU_16967 [Blattamonas nauphoetae]
MFFTLVAHVAFAADIPLAPFFGNPSESIPTIKLSDGTYVGAEITVGPKERTVMASIHDNIVTLNGSNPRKCMFIVNYTKLTLSDLRLFVPIEAPFIKGAGLTVTFENVFHEYNRRDYPLVSATWGSVYVENNSFQTNSTYGSTMFLLGETRRELSQDEVALTGCSFDSITVGGEYPFLSNPNINSIILRDCSFRNIQWKGRMSSTPPLTQLVRTEVSNCSFYRCDGPLSGGIIPAVQAEYSTITTSTFDTCTNAVSISGDIRAWTKSFTVTNTIFTNGSTAKRYPNGGALWFTRFMNLTMTNVTFANHNISGDGGAISMAGGFERISCHQCRFIGNDAYRGGALSIGKTPFPKSPRIEMSSCSFANDANAGRDIFFVSMGKNVTQKNFSNCTSRSMVGRVYDMETGRGYDWTNSPTA